MHTHTAKWKSVLSLYTHPEDATSSKELECVANTTLENYNFESSRQVHRELL